MRLDASAVGLDEPKEEEEVTPIVCIENEKEDTEEDEEEEAVVSASEKLYSIVKSQTYETIIQQMEWKHCSASFRKGSCHFARLAQDLLEDKLIEKAVLYKGLKGTSAEGKFLMRMSWCPRGAECRFAEDFSDRYKAIDTFGSIKRAQ